MKFKETLSFSCSPEKLWTLFESPEKFQEWNTVFQEVSGTFENDSPLTVKAAYFATPARTFQAKVTAWVPGKYLSFSYTKGPGNWWYEVEHIFRISREKKEKPEFVSEIYANGVRLRVGKLKFKSMFQKTLVKMHEGLKEKLATLS